MPKSPPIDRHIVLTTNGIAGACAAAVILLKHPHARIRLTSPRHLPTALEHLRGEGFAGTIHIAGVGVSPPLEELEESLRGLPKTAPVVWYAAADHPDVQRAASLKKHVKIHQSNAPTTARCILETLRVQNLAQALLIAELAEEAAKNKAPRSEQHRFCHDLVLAANRRFYFFGDDTLNEKAILYLAGHLEKTHELESAAEEYRRSPDALHPLGSSRAMKALRKQIGRMGPVPEPVLVTGPTGSGKEVMARALHITSGRAGAFVAVNCAVLGGNPQLVEDRLFGHVKGAFTGADHETKGAFEEAHGGTLFLDEVGELPAEVQAQLLRVLEDKQVRPVGTMKTRPVDVRIVAATHRDLGRMVAEGTFREDLLYRMNVLLIRVPPLRERPEDMKSIAGHIAAELEKTGYALRLSKKDWDAIRAFEWPGNVRQFLNVLKRAAYMERPVSELLAQEKQANHTSDLYGMRELLALYCPEQREDVAPAEEVYRAYMRHVLELFEGNITQTAKALGVAANTVRKHGGTAQGQPLSLDSGKEEMS
jgi:DNA-binding NtrC family response regulator